MKIAASDFDRTLFFPKEHFPDKNGIAETDMAAVDTWHAAGHHFGIVTGRSYQMLLHGVKDSPLHYDFAVCLTGAAIYDKTGGLISQSAIDNTISRKVISLPILQHSCHIACLTAYAAYICVQSEASWFRTLAKPIAFTQIDFFTAQCLKGICQISLQYKDEETAAAAVNEINNLQLGVTAYRNVQAIDIVRTDVNKAAGLNSILQAHKWEGNEVLTIGDGLNDLPMIKGFEGFTITSACAEVKQCANKIYGSVAEMLLDNLK